MGWLSDEEGGVHEGYVVGLVEEQVSLAAVGGAARRPVSSTVLRELTYYADQNRDVPKGGLPVAAFQVACDCGWRSRRFVAPYGARWYPYALDLGDEDLEAAARAEWRTHVEEERARGLASPRRLTPLGR